jgi:uncharacterized oligopeptide transporter (OPT) family protein
MRPPLAFPEGVACANVLLAGNYIEYMINIPLFSSGSTGGSAASVVVRSSLVSAFLKVLQAMLIAPETIGFGFILYHKAVFRLESSISAALIGVGYIVGWRVTLVFLLGGICNWLIAIPLSTGMGVILVSDEMGAMAAAYSAWGDQTRCVKTFRQ